MKVAILGASTKPDRYSHRAQKLLMEKGHSVYPVSPTGAEVLGVSGLKEIPEGMDTVTLYVSEKNLLPVLDQLIAAKPRRVIFNPGTESETAVKQLSEAGILTENACTLVLLNAGTF